MVRKEKHDIYLKQKSSEYNSEEKNDKPNNDETHGNFKQAWPAGTCLIVGDPVLTGIFVNNYQRTIKWYKFEISEVQQLMI